MSPSATILFVAESEPSVAVLAAHLLALASNDRVRTGAACGLAGAVANPVLRPLLAENMMPDWYLPPVHALSGLPAGLRGADVAVVLSARVPTGLRVVLPGICVSHWSFPEVPHAGVDALTALFDWRCLYAAVARRMSLMASLSPEALGRMREDTSATSLRFGGV